jgi:hypothetical protein
MELMTILLIIAIFTIFVGSSLLKSTHVNTIPEQREAFLNPFISKITDDIYISDAANALDYNTLKKIGIKQILIVGKELPRHGDLHFKVLHIKIDDIPNENIKKYFKLFPSNQYNNLRKRQNSLKRD